METREGARRGAPAPLEHATHWAQGMGRATLSALSALVGGALLITLGATMSICWTIHPLLTVIAGVAVLWLVSRLVGVAFRHDSRS